MNKFMVAAVVLLLPIAAQADVTPVTLATMKADAAIKIDLTKADLALSQHNLNAAVEALSDATRYFDHASDSAIHIVEIANQKVLMAITDKQIADIKPAPEKPKPVKRRLPLGYHDPNLWPYPGGASRAQRPGETFKDYVVPETRKGWLPHQSEAPPGVTPPAPPPPPGFVERMGDLTAEEHKTWQSYPFPH